MDGSISGASTRLDAMNRVSTKSGCTTDMSHSIHPPPQPLEGTPTLGGLTHAWRALCRTCVGKFLYETDNVYFTRLYRIK